jgi:hypothetical protein
LRRWSTRPFGNTHGPSRGKPNSCNGNGTSGTIRTPFSRGASSTSRTATTASSCSYRVVDVARPLFGNAPGNADNLVTIDFGCGPATWAVTMGWYYLALSGLQPPADRIGLQYIGVDQSAAAIRMAQSMTACPRLFRNDSLRFFCTSYLDPALLDRIGEFIVAARIADPLLVLNFSFFFASPTLDVATLIPVVRAILQRYGSHRIILTFQNPPEAILNQKWEQFRIGVPELHVIWTSVAPQHDSVRYNDTTGRRQFYGHSSRLYFQVLANRPAGVLLGAAGA